MSTGIKLELVDPAADRLLHEFRNFGEDVFRALDEVCLVSLDEIDASTTSFVVRDIRRKDIGEVTQTIKRLIKHHHFENGVKMTRL